MKTKLFLLGVLTLLAAATMAGHAKESYIGGTTRESCVIHGTTGDLTWGLTANGILVISGEGAMPDYEAGYVDEECVEYRTNAPWFGLEFTSVVIESGITTIGVNAFYDCCCLTSVTIPDSVTTIEGYAFHECASLTSVTIPNSITTIERSVFFDCRGLTSITIPDSVTTIKEWAFGLCTRMTDVTIMATTPPELGDYNFDRNPSHKSSRKSSDILHVPAGCVAAYEADEAWRTAFTNIVEQQ